MNACTLFDPEPQSTLWKKGAGVTSVTSPPFVSIRLWSSRTNSVCLRAEGRQRKANPVLSYRAAESLSPKRTERPSLTSSRMSFSRPRTSCSRSGRFSTSAISLMVTRLAGTATRRRDSQFRMRISTFSRGMGMNHWPGRGSAGFFDKPTTADKTPHQVGLVRESS
jgi:hypothetical protein